MKTPLKLFVAATLTLGLGACATTPEKLGQMLEQHPEILANAIEKNPDVFMNAVQKAAQGAQVKARENEQATEEARIAAEMKNPLQPVIDDSRGFLGPKTAEITIVEYTDFQCPFCARGYANIEEVRKKYGDKVRVLVKNLPLRNHPMAMPAAKRFEALRLQGVDKAYAYYHEVFKNQAQLENGEKYLDSVVKKVGGDQARLKKDMDGALVQAKIRADMEEAEKFDMSGTPAFVVNGVSVRGAYPPEFFYRIIDAKLTK